MDWLAVDLWSMVGTSKTGKQILMSATYRQSAINKEKRDKDPENIYLLCAPSEDEG
jgi:hypothetical protein